MWGYPASVHLCLVTVPLPVLGWTVFPQHGQMELLDEGIPGGWDGEGGQSDHLCSEGCDPSPLASSSLVSLNTGGWHCRLHSGDYQNLPWGKWLVL
jgi:hypothetical protein